MSHIRQFLQETINIAKYIDADAIQKLVDELIELRKHSGRLFCFGSGGGAANAEHAVNDFRKLCHIEAYCPTHAELTAWANDGAWEDTFSKWLAASNPKDSDALFIFSVGGGTDNASPNIVKLFDDYPRMKILGIVGNSGGATAIRGYAVVVIPSVNPDRITPYTEAWQMVVLHLLVSHPELQKSATTW